MPYYHHYNQYLYADRELYLQECQPPLAKADLSICRYKGGAPNIDYSQAHHIHSAPGYVGGSVLDIFLIDPSNAIIEYDCWLFLLDLSGAKIEYFLRQEHESSDFALTIDFFILPIFMILAHQETIVPVHGSSILYRDMAFVFIGESGAGKSTTVHALSKSNGQILVDDMTLVSLPQCEILAGAPSVRLWQNDDADETIVRNLLVSNTVTKRWLRYPDRPFSKGRYPLAAIICLSAYPPDAKIANESFGFERHIGRQAFVELLEQTFSFSQPLQSQNVARLKNTRVLFDHIPYYRFEFKHSKSGQPTHIPALYKYMDAVIENVAKSS